MPHTFVHPPVHLYTTIHLYAPIYLYAPNTPYMFKHPPYVLNAPLCIFMFWGYLHVIWGCRGSHMLDTPKGEWMPPHVSNTPMHCMLPCISIFCGISACSVGKTLLMLGYGGVSMSVRLLVSFSTYIGCPLCFILCFFVLYYVSSLYYHGYNYYSSGDCGVFWYVIYIISDCGSLFDGASYNLGSA